MTANNETAPPRVAVVTGGSRGIGRSVVRRLAGDGLSIVVVYVSDHVEANAAVAEAEAAGAKAIALAADVADERATASVFDQSEQAFGGIDVVINAAGVMSLAPLAEFDLAGPGQPSPVPRPPQVLAAFAVARAEPGEQITARLTIPARAFARYDEDLAGWIWPGGEWTVYAGRSSRDLPLSAPVRCGGGC